MTYKHFLFAFVVLFLFSCKKEQENYLYRIEGKKIEISDSIPSNAEIDKFIEPFSKHIDKDLDSVISYAMDTYSKSDGELNTAIGNLFADVTYEQANPVLNSRTNENIDLVILNHGGIRAIISKGNITKRTAYEIMPFENSLVVAKLKGTHIQEAVEYLTRAKRAHPIAKLNITLNKDYNLIEATIDGNKIDPNKYYNVLTNDYLYNGGDRMDFFQKRDTVYVLNYKVRSALMDYFIKTDTLNPKIDNRFIIRN